MVQWKYQNYSDIVISLIFHSIYPESLYRYSKAKSANYDELRERRKMSNFDKFDEKLQKILKLEKPSTKEETTQNDISTIQASDDYKEWLQVYIQDFHMFEEYEKIRLICQHCSEKIVNDKYLVIPDPSSPEDYSKTKFYHSKGNCDPRIKKIKDVREKWLKEHDPTLIERNKKIEEILDTFLSSKESLDIEEE